MVFETVNLLKIIKIKFKMPKYQINIQDKIQKFKNRSFNIFKLYSDSPLKNKQISENKNVFSSEIQMS